MSSGVTNRQTDRQMTQEATIPSGTLCVKGKNGASNFSEILSSQEVYGINVWMDDRISPKLVINIIFYSFVCTASYFTLRYDLLIVKLLIL